MMPLNLSDVLAELSAVMPDSLVMEQAETLSGGQSSNERLAQFVANVTVSLHDPNSTDGANLGRIAVNLERAAYHLAAAAKRLRLLAEG